MKMDVPHKYRCAWDEETTLLQSQTQERYTLFAVPWSRRRGDGNSSAVDDTVQATSCPAAFITFINAFSSAECCSVVESAAPFPSYTEQAVNMFPHTPLLLCVERWTQKSENCLLITLFVRVHPHVYLHILIHPRRPAMHGQVRGKGECGVWIHKRMEATLILWAWYMVGTRPGRCMS